MIDDLLRTPLYEVHRESGAKLVSFAGWEMPVQYEGLISEHLAVRTAAGLFDVSHMGEILIEGPDALALVQFVSSNDAGKLQDGQAHYSGLMTPQGTFVDDMLVHRFAPDRYFLCVNAANTQKDVEWIQQHAAGKDVQVENVSSEYAQLAVQGPKAIEIVQHLTDVDLLSIKYYWFQQGEVAGVPCIIARTGYTGEDGVELYTPPDEAPALWKKILERGREYGIKPAGLAARNTLRLEAKMTLYGHDIDDTTTVLEADLGWICKLAKGDFLGRDALVRQKEEGLRRKLIGFEVLDRAPARDGYPVVVGDAQAGCVTSGSPAPFLKKNIGLTYLPIEYSNAGTRFEVLIRGRAVPAEVANTPFYKRPSERGASESSR